MAQLRPRYRTEAGKKVLSGYAAVFYDPQRNPKEKYVTLRTKDKRVARNRLVDLERQYSLGEFDPWNDLSPQDDLMIGEAIDQYLKARTDRRPKSQRADASSLSLFARTMPVGFMVQHVEEHHVQAFLNRDLSSATVNTYHARLKCFFTWCVSQGIIKRNPLERLKRPKLQRKEKRFLTREQYETILRCIEADAVMKEGGMVKQASLKEGEVRWLADVVRFAIGTGLRVGELTSLRWHSVDLNNRLITIRNEAGFTTKSGHERTLPIDGEALEVVEKLFQMRSSESDGYVFTGTSRREGSKDKLNSTYVSKRFLRYVRLAKLPEGISFHTLRHTYVSWMIMAGVPVPVVQKLAGHADITTTMRYAHLAPNSLRDAVAKVFG